MKWLGTVFFSFIRRIMISNVERVPLRGPATATGEATWAKSGGAHVGAPTATFHFAKYVHVEL